MPCSLGCVIFFKVERPISQKCSICNVEFHLRWTAAWPSVFHQKCHLDFLFAIYGSTSEQFLVCCHKVAKFVLVRSKGALEIGHHRCYILICSKSWLWAQFMCLIPYDKKSKNAQNGDKVASASGNLKTWQLLISVQARLARSKCLLTFSSYFLMLKIFILVLVPRSKRHEYTTWPWIFDVRSSLQKNVVIAK